MIATGNYTLYSWDNRNRLTLVQNWDAHGNSNPADDTNTSAVGYVYDAFNQMVRRVGANGGFTNTIFVYSGGQVVLQFDKASFAAAAASNLSHRYVWNPQAVDQLMADEQVTSLSSAGSTYWTMADDQGSARDVLDSSGKLRLHRDFDSFGNVVAETHYAADGITPVTAGQSGYIDEAFEYTGRWFDKATGLQNNLNRWYDPAMGRWMSEDPIGYNADPSNLYRYVNNSPMQWVDPSGLGWLPPDYKPPSNPPGDFGSGAASQPSLPPRPPGLNFRGWDIDNENFGGYTNEQLEWYRNSAVDNALEKNNDLIRELNNSPECEKYHQNIENQLERRRKIDLELERRKPPAPKEPRGWFWWIPTYPIDIGFPLLIPPNLLPHGRQPGPDFA